MNDLTVFSLNSEFRRNFELKKVATLAYEKKGYLYINLTMN